MQGLPRRNSSQDQDAEAARRREPFRRVGFLTLLKDSIKVAIKVAKGGGKPINVTEGTGVLLEDVGFQYKGANYRYESVESVRFYDLITKKTINW